MLVNDIDIKTYNSKLLTVDIQSSALSNESDWIRNALTPVLIRNKRGFKVIKLELLFKGESRDSILQNISDFIINFIDPVKLKLDKYNNNYKCILNNHEIKKTISRSAYKVELELSGFEFGEEIELNFKKVTLGTINAVGNIKSPCIIKITPTVNDLIDFIITGLTDDPITINTLRVNETVIINAIDGKVTVNGINKYSDVDMWEYPRVVPGTNNITFSKDTCNVSIKYYPMYL